MPDLKKLYTPKEATLLYNRNKIRFNPTSYTLKEHLILNRNVQELTKETISAYTYAAENLLFDAIISHETAAASLHSKLPTKMDDGSLPVSAADAAAVKEYNLSLALDYLTDCCSVPESLLKNSDLMNAIIRMCIALDSVESCGREMYWFITDLCTAPYAELHKFEHLKKAFEVQPLHLPMSFTHDGIDVMFNNTSGTVSPIPTDLSCDENFRQATLYKAHYYAIEFLWAYLRLNDPELKRALAWSIEACGGEGMFRSLFTVANSEIVIDKEIEAMVTINDPANRFKAYQEYMEIHDNDILKWAVAMSSANMYMPMNPIVAMFIGYAEGIAVTHARVNSLAILYTYCLDKGYISKCLENDLDNMFNNVTGLGAALGVAINNPEKALMDLDPSAPSAPNTGGEVDDGQKYQGDNGIFEALDTLNASFKDGGYTFDVKDIRVTDTAVKSAYDNVCSKVSLINKNLIRKIKEIKVYNTGGKNPGTSSGRLDRKAMYRYKYDPDIFYNNNYKQLESDLAFGIILDESGSMSGKGIADGKVTMIVLHETLKALGINHSIIGHTSRHGDHSCSIERYQSFKEDKTYTVCKNYALANIAAHSRNCDSGALYYMERAMDRVQNKDKIVLIFSDGHPTACSSTDLIKQVSRMEQKGIKVIGIGIDFPSISKYYSEYANGRNLQDMLNIVTSILQEYILKKKVN